ncbi:MAG: hypothetical protein RLP09_41675 [Sandaracinaceae bacterium]|nr:MAG: hypothetical protein EVA89_16025 [Sandaracinaceae bacterium]HBQ13681.1 hypothetical protein [Myxococcales bacterium]
MARTDDPQLAAFHRLITDAHHGGQAKVDVLVALSQRLVHLVPWPQGIEGFRTLVNSEGVAALPIFTHRDALEEAARRYGWLDAHGNAPAQELGARAALNYAVRENLSYVVIDIADDHALEIAREEFEPLLSPAARRDSSGPFAGAGKISSSLIRAVRPTPPPSAGPMRATPAPGSLAAPRVPAEIRPPTSTPGLEPAPSMDEPEDDGFSVSKDFDPSAQSFGGGTSVSLQELTSMPSDALFDSLTVVLRNYPEVEWAAMVQASRGPSASVPTVALRVDTGFRQRINDIVGEVRRAGDAEGAQLDVLLLDDAELMRNARATGVVFYPWRKK